MTDEIAKTPRQPLSQRLDAMLHMFLDRIEKNPDKAGPHALTFKALSEAREKLRGTDGAVGANLLASFAARAESESSGPRLLEDPERPGGAPIDAAPIAEPARESS